MAPLTVSVNKIADGVFIVIPTGPVDTDTYTILQKKLDTILKPVPKVLIFDIKDVNYVSSMGITVIINAKETVEKSGGIVLLLNLQPQIQKLFDIIKAIPNSHIFSSRQELDRYLDAIQKQEIEKRQSA